MPYASGRPCTQPGCSAVVRCGSRCEKHQRPSAQARGYDARWQKAREAFLFEHPLCPCGARATDVDHVVPHKGDLVAFWNRSNWRALCHTCHSRKTATQDGGFGRG